MLCYADRAPSDRSSAPSLCEFSLSVLALNARAPTGRDSALLVIIHMTDAKTFGWKIEALAA
ncbi:hypothetical protein MPL3365_70091 [Mesorhizobium plurifarium]|uniref:Uncharacterized protein n=1 Tax=Mesorhizobium plurifarium TaxID=69974 RepID=A0A090GBZ5_MESPL|nr:hypothetical protein MPL3365_70091 [Mesorhizobium plurifarium]